MSISFLLSLCHLSFSRRYNSALCSFSIWFLPIFQATLTDRDDFLFFTQLSASRVEAISSQPVLRL